MTVPDTERRIEVRSAIGADAVAVAALAVQVFLDTYATDGVRPDLAREAFAAHSVEAFARRLAPGSDARVDLAVDGEHVLGFVETATVPIAPLPGLEPGLELRTLYVQPRFHRRGIGGALLAAADRRARVADAASTWLTVWEGNANARAFYARRGFGDVGETRHVFEGRAFDNRVMTRPIEGSEGRDGDA